MTVILIVIYTLASGATHTVFQPMSSFAECYATGSRIVVGLPPGKVTYKCRVDVFGGGGKGVRCKGCGVPEPLAKCEYCGRKREINAFERQAQADALSRGAYLQQMVYAQQNCRQTLSGRSMGQSLRGLMGLGRLW